MKRNLTVHLDDDLIRRAEVLAAERGTSVSGSVKPRWPWQVTGMPQRGNPHSE